MRISALDYGGIEAIVTVISSSAISLCPSTIHVTNGREVEIESISAHWLVTKENP